MNCANEFTFFRFQSLEKKGKSTPFLCYELVPTGFFLWNRPRNPQQRTSLSQNLTDSYQIHQKNQIKQHKKLGGHAPLWTSLGSGHLHRERERERGVWVDGRRPRDANQVGRPVLFPSLPAPAALQRPHPPLACPCAGTPLRVVSHLISEAGPEPSHQCGTIPRPRHAMVGSPRVTTGVNWPQSLKNQPTTKYMSKPSAIPCPTPKHKQNLPGCNEGNYHRSLKWHRNGVPNINDQLRS